MTSRAAGTVNLLAFRRVGVSRALSVDPFPGIHRILLVRTGRGYAGNLGNPVFAQEFVRMAVKDAILAGPFFLSGTPQRAEAHVNYTGAAPLPLKTAGRVFFNAARPLNFWVCPNRHFPEIEKAWTGKAGILRALALFQQIAPRVTVGRAATHFANLPALQFDFDLGEGA